MAERLHKLLAQHGFGSRREIEKWMVAGRVLLNSQPAQPGSRFEEGDRVVVDGRDVTARLQVAATVKVIAYHKPQGQPVSQPASLMPDPNDSDAVTVMECLPAIRGSRWLVINTMQAGDSGLLLLTTDGKLADALRRRSSFIPTAYFARVLIADPEFDVTAIPTMVRYEDETIEFEAVELTGGEGANRWFRLPSRRAHRRAAVRALFDSVGLKVSRIIQVQFGDIQLPRDLPRGRHRALNDTQVEQLYRFAELSPPEELQNTRNNVRRHAAVTVRSKGKGRQRHGSDRRTSSRTPIPVGSRKS